jgi:hypothetical protein
VKETGFTHTVLQYNSLQEKRVKYGNQTVQQSARSSKKNDNFKIFKREIKSFLLHHALYSEDEFISFWTNMDCNSLRVLSLAILTHFH